MKTYITKLKEFVETQNFKRALKVVGILAVTLFIFQAGVSVGFRKASFYGEFGNNFRKNFGEQKGGSRGMVGRDIPNAHGIIGGVIDVSLPTIVVAGDDGVEKIVSIGEKTLIRRFRDNIRAEEIVIGDSVVIVGAPGREGMINATLIRIMPTSSAVKTATSTNLNIQ